MPTRSHTTFKKRQKELARQEKQRDKAAKRMQRKIEKTLPGYGEETPEEGSERSLALDEAAPDLETPHHGGPA
jgi:hypothetical protein